MVRGRRLVGYQDFGPEKSAGGLRMKRQQSGRVSVEELVKRRLGDGADLGNR